MVFFGMWWTLSDPDVRDREMKGGRCGHTVLSGHICCLSVAQLTKICFF